MEWQALVSKAAVIEAKRDRLVARLWDAMGQDEALYAKLAAQDAKLDRQWQAIQTKLDAM